MYSENKQEVKVTINVSSGTVIKVIALGISVPLIAAIVSAATREIFEEPSKKLLSFLKEKKQARLEKGITWQEATEETKEEIRKPEPPRNAPAKQGGPPRNTPEKTRVRSKSEGIGRA